MPFSSLSVKLTCIECGQQTAKTFDWLREHADRFDCAHCGVTVVIDQKQVDDELVKLVGAIDELEHQIHALRARLRLVPAHSTSER